MAAAVLTAAEIFAALAAGGWNLDQMIEHLKLKGETKHAQTLENLKAAATPVTSSDSLWDETHANE